MSEQNRLFLKKLLAHLRGCVPNNDFDAVANIVNQFTDKQISGRTIYYIWQQEQQIKAWMVKAIMLAAIKKEWKPNTQSDVDKLLFNFGGAGDNQAKKIDNLLNEMANYKIKVQMDFFDSIDQVVLFHQFVFGMFLAFKKAFNAQGIIMNALILLALTTITPDLVLEKPSLNAEKTAHYQIYRGGGKPPTKKDN